MEEQNIDIKVVLLGNSGVGKTNLIRTYMGENFDPNSFSNLVSSLSQKKITINNQDFELSFWDTAGQEQFRTVTKSLINGANIVLYIYSIIDRKSLEDVDYWISYVKENLNCDYVSSIVGNKSDLLEESVVNEEMLKS